MVRPLTRRSAGGSLYRREDRVDRQIATAMALGPDDLVRRIAVREIESDEFLQEECLVYLIREHHRAGHRELVDRLSEALVGRSAKFVNSKVVALGGDHVDDAFRDVFAEVFEKVLDLEGDRGDFLQVRFWLAVGRMATSAFGRHSREINRASAGVSLSALAGHDDAPGDEVGGRRVTKDVADASISMEERTLYREGLRAIPEPQRTAFLLRHFDGWPIEADDPDAPCISRYFDKTPRTIRNWLKEAEQALRAWRGDTR